MARPQAWLYLALGAALLLALWFGVRYLGDLDSSASGPRRHHLELSLHDGVHRGATVFRVNQGDEVALTINSDREEALHLHGYEKHIVVEAGTPTTLRFDATLSGRHRIELHRNDSTLCFLDVYPN
ncbi:hypothetical protein I6N98_15175 [Spongiibacter nanhainus]|uniref:EfeO-type cupredoxin-like domain-containing protein n=1 Tax=Spongiibacter nanhainus TaxID=2794344 RepID=A0A7T4QZL9_9GAMM|nr:hypothetical protein [Spongiibacter nanhainus]QQD17671.1 hypothetical protein I6N98_15175 [Spongiibacter nanhainus]